MLRSTANALSRKRFENKALLLGQIGVDMAPCEGDCAFCFFAKSNTAVVPSVLSYEEIASRCKAFAAGGAAGVFLMTMHRFGFDWFRDLCAGLRRELPASFQILANVGDISGGQMRELKDAGVSGAYHVCRIREGKDSRMEPSERIATIDRIIESKLDWYNMCEPIGPEHSPEELADQIWVGIDRGCTQHGAMQRFPVSGSPLYDKGEISVLRLSQITAVIALATREKAGVRSIAVNVSNPVALFSGANAFFPEAGEPDGQERSSEAEDPKSGFTTALWRSKSAITTADCRAMLGMAGFSHLMDANGKTTSEITFP
jgi:biotin synthase